MQPYTGLAALKDGRRQRLAACIELSACEAASGGADSTSHRAAGGHMRFHLEKKRQEMALLET